MTSGLPMLAWGIADRFRFFVSPRELRGLSRGHRARRAWDSGPATPCVLRNRWRSKSFSNPALPAPAYSPAITGATTPRFAPDLPLGFRPNQTIPVAVLPSPAVDHRKNNLRGYGIHSAPQDEQAQVGRVLAAGASRGARKRFPANLTFAFRITIPPLR